MYLAYSSRPGRLAVRVPFEKDLQLFFKLFLNFYIYIILQFLIFVNKFNEKIFMVLRGGIEPPFKDFQSSANPSQLPKHMNGTSGGSRTHLALIKSQLPDR